MIMNSSEDLAGEGCTESRSYKTYLLKGGEGLKYRTKRRRQQARNDGPEVIKKPLQPLEEDLALWREAVDGKNEVFVASERVSDHSSEEMTAHLLSSWNPDSIERLCIPTSGAPLNQLPWSNPEGIEESALPECETEDWDIASFPDNDDSQDSTASSSTMHDWDTSTSCSDTEDEVHPKNGFFSDSASDSDSLGGDVNRESGNSFKNMLKFFNKFVSFTKWNTNLSFSDILLMVLSLHMEHNFTLTAVTDIMKMLNLILGTKLFPSSNFMFKKMFNPQSGMVFHCVCKHCGYYLGVKKGNNELKCSSCGFLNYVSGYSYENCFAAFDVGKDIAQVNEHNFEHIISKKANNKAGYSDIFDGKMYRSAFQSSAESTSYVSVTFNTDGSPITKDSRTAIWPIYLMINELPLKLRRNNMILASVWYGREKPRMEVYMKPFVEKMNDLQRNGFSFSRSGRKIKFNVLTLCCCVDSLARAPMQGISTFSGYGGCSWCLHAGENINGTMKYTATTPAPKPRTEENFRRSCIKFHATGVKDNGVNSASPLINLSSFSMVWGFTPDYMHCIPLGVVKRFLEMWLSEVGRPYYIGAPKTIHLLDKMIQGIKPQKYLKRLPISLSQRKVMKARVLENWMLFYSIPVLNGTLPQPLFKHWKILVGSVFILLQDHITDTDIDRVEVMLQKFVNDTQKLYGSREMTYNVHQVSHLAESARQWGPLWSRCGFPFESSNGKFRRVLKASKGVPHQIFRNFEVSQSCRLLLSDTCSQTVHKFCTDLNHFPIRTSNQQEREHFLGKQKRFACSCVLQFPANVTSLLEYDRLVRDGVSYSKSALNDKRKTNNSFVELENGTFAIIKHILLGYKGEASAGRAYAAVVMLKTSKLSGVEHIHKVNESGGTLVVEFSKLKNVSVHVNIREERYICSIPAKHFLLNL